MDSTARNATLKKYLDYAGILSCNTNQYMLSLSDVGFGWNDVTTLIDTHELFYCKVYRNRTVYLSNSVYFLLKQIKAQKPLTISAQAIYELLDTCESLETSDLKKMVCLDVKTYDKAFSFLLENMYITAFKNGRRINDNWSTFLYSTTETWEKHVQRFEAKYNPEEILKTILTRTISEKEFIQFMRSCRK